MDAQQTLFHEQFTQSANTSPTCRLPSGMFVSCLIICGDWIKDYMPDFLCMDYDGSSPRFSASILAGFL